MKILFCGEGYSEARRRLAPLLPNDEIAFVDPRQLRSALAGVAVVVPYMTRIDEAIIGLGEFGLIQQFGVGLETVDVESATRAGVWVARIPSGKTGNAVSVAEHALLLMLALARDLAGGARSVNARVLGEPAGLALAEKRACVVGLGAVGSAVAARLHALGMRVTGVREHAALGAPDDVGVDRVFGPDALGDALADADFVILCVNFGERSRHLIGRAAFGAMKRGAYVINVARGGLIEPDALLWALESGIVAGAGLDVFWEEPVDPEHPIFRHNVIATPHVAGVTDLSYQGIARAFAENVERFRRGEAPLHAVNAPQRVRRPAAPRGA
ncbi:MAG TPA: NAD(P)-dependent oxidoreductase [Candidatus Eremiobacteraceae bacterium]|nr:NAD(P)-dependent oxidoreductase [Candidatus Eremiobacteraceae bacterium]